MIWFVALKGACITMKQNLVCEGVPLEFFILRGDVVKLRNTRSDPTEREFGKFRMNIWEFNTLEFSHLTQTTEFRSRMMSTGGFVPSPDPKKGHQAPHAS